MSPKATITMTRLITMSGLVAATAVAQTTVLLDEPFNYTSDAELEAVWNASGTSNPDYHLDLGVGNSEPSYAMPSPENNYQGRLARNLGGDCNPTDEQALALSFDFYLPTEGSETWWSGARHYVELRGYSGNVYGSGDLESLLAIGLYNNSDDLFQTEYHQGRVSGGVGWITLDEEELAPLRSPGWHSMEIWVWGTSIEFWVDGELSEVEARPQQPNPPGFDCVVLGSDLTANGHDLWIDNLVIIGSPMVVEPGWTFARAIDCSGNPRAAHYNPVDGKIYVGRLSPKGLYRVEGDDSIITVWSGDDIAGVVADIDGDIFATDDYSGEIFRTEYGQTGRQTWVSGWHSGDDDPVGMAIAPDDYTGAVLQPSEALMIDRGWDGADEVWGWSPDTAEGEWVVYADNGTLLNGVDIAIGRYAVYLVDTGEEETYGPGPGIIYRLENSSGTLTAVDTSPDVLVDPMAVAIDPLTQDLFVLDTDAGRVVRVQVSGHPPTGQVTEMFTGFATNWSWAGLDVSPDGLQIIVTDLEANKIYTFTRELDYVYVDQNASNPHPDGMSWSKAFPTLQGALDEAVAGTTIRVADGTYTPYTGILEEPRDATFQLLSGVTIEGGYAGDGAPNPDARDVRLYETILSGDIDGDDGAPSYNSDNNCYHVVSASGASSGVTLDGLTITAGNANGQLSPYNQGGWHVRP